MRTETRWCMSCASDTLHDRAARVVPGTGALFRALLALVSIGISEMLVDTTCTCQRCGRKETLNG